MGSVQRVCLHVKSVCIIGSGPSGLAAAKYLIAEQAFSRVTIFEQQSRVGGLWNHVSCDGETLKSIPIPQTKPSLQPDKPIWSSSENSNRNSVVSPVFITPMYDRLETNLPREFMGFSDLNWEEDCQLFPRHEEVLAYIERYSTDITHLIQFRTQVLNVHKTVHGKWDVETQTLHPEGQNRTQVHQFDAVVVATGHFDVPYIPSVTGISTWNSTYPGRIIHSKFFRDPSSYCGRKVIITGMLASGMDISNQISHYCQSPILLSSNTDSAPTPDPGATAIRKPRIAEFLLRDRSVRFADGSVESGIDAIIYCTGYLYSFPFLQSLNPPVVTTGERVHQLYQHLFYQPDPSLVFMVVNQRVVPFPMAEAQSSVVARVFAGRIQLPGPEEMEAWEKTVVEKMGAGKGFHLLSFPMDADYLNMLHDWAVSADGEERTGNNVKVGKIPPHWGERARWARERFPVMKATFHKLEEERHGKRTIEDIGFCFEEWKKEQAAKSER